MEETSNDRLKRARIEAGYETAEAAIRRFGWEPSTYRSHENGQTPVPSEAAKDYARAFGVTPQWIVFNVGGTDDPGLDNLLQGKPPELKRQAINVVRALVGEPLIEAPPPQLPKPVQVRPSHRRRKN